MQITQDTYDVWRLLNDIQMRDLLRGGSNKRREMTLRRVKGLHSAIHIIPRFLADDNSRYSSIKNNATAGKYSQLVQPTRADENESGSLIPLHGVWCRYRSGFVAS